MTSARFSVPKSPKRNIYQITKFLGCDYTSSPSMVDEYHSQDCVNMTRYMPGKIRKRMGYKRVTYSNEGSIHAIWKWDDNCYLVHVGTTICVIRRDESTGEFNFSSIHDNPWTISFPDFMNGINEFPDEKITFIRVKEYGLLFGAGIIGLLDIDYSNSTPHAVFRDGSVGDSHMSFYVPKVTISKSPTGGGTSYEAVNLLSSHFEDSFYVSSGDATETKFHTSFHPLRGVFGVYILDQDGNWNEAPGNSYSTDFQNGIIEFNTAPGASPIEGEDNVRIHASSQQLEDGWEKLANCKFGICYGFGGNPDRAFISGNKDYPNYDWHSEKDDITYFPDTAYSVLGTDATAINGYAIVSNYLVTLKAEDTDSQTAIIRNGVLDSESNVVFQVVKSLQGYPILSPKTSISIGTEPLFLSNNGIMAITPSDISGERIMNSRSYFFNRKLLKEERIKDSFAVGYGDFYLLFVPGSGHVYVLDTLQSITTENTPYSTRQYAAFFWDDIYANCAACIDGAVYFGDSSGRLFKSYTDENDISSYSDFGLTYDNFKKPIYCKYETADLDAMVFYKLKTYRYFALKLFSAATSSVKVSYYKDGVWELIKDDQSSVGEFTFSQMKFSRITFKTDKGTRIVSSKIRIKKVDHMKFRIENDGLDEPFMIDEFGVEYTQSGNYKN